MSKLPKQWKHWCQLNKITSNHYGNHKRAVQKRKEKLAYLFEISKTSEIDFFKKSKHQQFYVFYIKDDALHDETIDFLHLNFNHNYSSSDKTIDVYFFNNNYFNPAKWWATFYSPKHNRYFRALPHLDKLQICDGNFNKWGDSVNAEVPMPKTHKEFNEAIKTLLEQPIKKSI